MENKRMICSYCGGDNFVDVGGDSFGGISGGVVPLSNSKKSGSPLCLTVCLKCGTVNRMYFKNPHELIVKPKSNRSI